MNLLQDIDWQWDYILHQQFEMLQMDGYIIHMQIYDDIIFVYPW